MLHFKSSLLRGSAWKRIKIYGENEELSRQALESAIEFIDKVVEDSGHVLEKAFKLAVEYGITVYDALFVSLAVSLNAKLITTDRKLYEKLKGTDLEVFLQIVSRKTYSGEL